MSPSRWAFAALLTPLALAASGGCARPAGDEPALRRYFTADQIAEHDDFNGPLAVHGAASELAFVAFGLAFLLLRLNRRLAERCERLAADWGPRLGRLPLVGRLDLLLTRLWGGPGWGGALLFAVAYVAIITLLFLPSSYYFDFVVERRHGVSVASLERWGWDFTKHACAGIAGASGLTLGLYGLARRRRRWWLWLGIPSSLLLVASGVLDPARVAAYHDFAPLPPGEVRTAVEELMAAAGLEYEGVYSLEVADVTRRVNAFFMGQGPSRRLVLTDTLLSAMGPDEVRAALAHEISHLREPRTARTLAAAALLTPLLWLASVLLRRLGRGRRWGFEDDRDVASLPALYLMLGLVSFLGAPLSSAWSREREREADRAACELTGDPAALRSVMVKGAVLSLTDLRPPLWVRLTSSHPPILERLAATEAWAAAHGSPLPEARPELFALAEPRSAPTGE